jgi:4-hydroxy-tetrahydrodipicolinate reductase
VKKAYRVAVAGPGGLGACAIREVHRLPETELAGVLAYSPAKHGVDAGELVGIGPIGVRTTTKFDEFLKIDAQCVIYTARDFGDWRADKEILALLEAGKNVITPLPYHHLRSRGEDVAARFKAAAEKGGATLHGSGITPGFFNERLALLLTGLSNDITAVRFQEFFNAEPLAGAIETLQLFGFGAPLEQVEQNVAVAIMAENYLKQPILFAAERLGIKLDRIERKSQHRVAGSAIKTPAMTIEPGMVGCVSYAWTAYVGGKPFYTTEVYWYLGPIMRPESAKGDDFWTIEIEGRPSLRATVESKASFAEDIYIRAAEPTPPGYLSTVVAMVQSIPVVIEAAPGLLSPALPQFHWKPDLRDPATHHIK